MNLFFQYKEQPLFLRFTLISWLAIIGVLMGWSATAQTSVNHWETAVYDSSVWRYKVPSSNLGSSWTESNFDDSNWQEAKGGFGYGDDDDATIVTNVLAVFIRKKFLIDDLDAIESMLLHVDYDDGYIAYLNGVEIGRSNMGNIQFPQFDQASLELHEAKLYTGQEPESILFNKAEITDLLLQGENILTVQVHNTSTASSDLTTRVFLSLGINNGSTFYGNTPDWFVTPVQFESSDLPIIILNTSGTQIPDNTRIVADMGIIDNGTGARNFITDLYNNYNGKISIETRGESSQYFFPKKSYSLETQTILGENNNVSLLGMPVENDWILYAPYSDKSLIRNVLAYKMGRDMGRYASRTSYCEVVLNGEYQGIYVLMEKIKRDKNRVDVSKLTPEDISGDDLTGGYLLRIDKIDGNDYPAWTSTPVPQLPSENTIDFQYFDPKGGELLSVQQDYIKNYIFEFESALSGTDFDTPTGYANYIAEPTFIDFMMVNEVSKNVDSYIFSTYLYKDKNGKGRKLKMGPLWDFNLAFGNVDYHENSQFAPGWMYNDDYRIYWFRRLMSDPVFANRFQCRWDELRTGILSNDYMVSTIDSLAIRLEESQERNYAKWKILGEYVWPNQVIGSNYQDEIDFVKQWTLDRLAWMDVNLNETCIPIITSLKSENKIRIKVFPNPSNRGWQITGLPPNKEYAIVIYNQLGDIVKMDISKGANYKWAGENKEGKNVASGIYIIKITDKASNLYAAKLIKME